LGGLSSKPLSVGIDGRINWVGVGPKGSDSVPVGYRGPIVEFDRFALFDQSGPKLQSIAPALAHHIFGIHRRVIMSDGVNDTIQCEIKKSLLSPTHRRGRGPHVYPKDRVRAEAREGWHMPAT
jgi:hypothetical protein